MVVLCKFSIFLLDFLSSSVALSSSVSKSGMLNSVMPMPYASTIFWKPAVNLFVLLNVGGAVLDCTAVKMGTMEEPLSSCKKNI